MNMSNEQSSCCLTSTPPPVIHTTYCLDYLQKHEYPDPGSITGNSALGIVHLTAWKRGHRQKSDKNE